MAGTGVLKHVVQGQESHFCPAAVKGLQGFTVLGTNQEDLFIEGQATAKIQMLD